jgi:hypothetical protein
MIKRRLVHQIAGYDPVDARGHYRRFMRGLPTFARTWNVAASASAFSEAEGRWTVTTQGPNWKVEAVHQPLAWDDIIRGDYAKPMLPRLGKFALALFDIFRTGTVFRYFRANFQYGFFFLFPVIYLIGFALIGWLLGRWIAGLLALQGSGHAFLAAAIGIAIFFLLLQWPGRRWRVLQALDDWIFSWDYLHGRRPDMEARLDRFARQLVEQARDPTFDEIVVLGHSLGATMAVSVVARALELDAKIGMHGPKLCVLTVGSTIPKFSLHPDAARVRRDIARVASDGAVEWAEYHARADPISFYKFDPLTEQRVADRFDRKPVIRMVGIRGMRSPEPYRRIRPRFMRVHHQFVMANELRNAYDFYMMGCGPIPFMRCVMTMEGPAALVAADGSYAE